MKLIGVNIRRMRELQKLTLRELARRMGVTASFLSQIESGKSSPSLVTLKKIVDQLNTTMGRLFSEEPEQSPEPVLRGSRPNAEKNMGKGIRVTLLTSPDFNKQMEPLLFKLDRGANSGDAQYKHYGQEFVLVLKGVLDIALNDVHYQLHKGDSIYFNSSTPHQFKNADKNETEALWVITPPTF
ncbi:MAG: XRE family transcriptional regulator [Fibrobacterota bacterium]